MKKSLRVKTVALTLMLTMVMGLTVGCSGNKGEQAKDVAADSKAGTKQTEMKTVGIVQFAEHKALEDAKRGFMDGLAANGFKEGENITFDVKNAQQDQANLPTITQGFVNSKVDLICAIATPAAQSAAQATADQPIPIVATAVTDFADAKLVESNDKPGTNVTGTNDMNPVTKQVDMLIEMVPNLKTIGVIYTSSEPNSALQVKIMKDYAASKGLACKEATISTVNDIQQAAQSLVGKVEGIYIPTDNTVAASMSTLLKISEPAKLPIVCGEAGPVEAGGTATIGIDYYKLGVQTGEMAAKILKGEAKPETMPIESLKDMTITVNKKAAERINLTIPQAILGQDGVVIVE